MEYFRLVCWTFILGRCAYLGYEALDLHTRYQDPQLKELVAEVAEKINTRAIPIFKTQHDASSSITYRTFMPILNHMFINDQLLSDVSEKALKFVIAHEYGHLYVEGKNIEMELNADNFAYDLGYGCGAVEYFQYNLDTYGDSAQSTHPQTSIRLKLATEVCNNGN